MFRRHRAFSAVIVLAAVATFSVVQAQSRNDAIGLFKKAEELYLEAKWTHIWGPKRIDEYEHSVRNYSDGQTIRIRLVD